VLALRERLHEGVADFVPEDGLPQQRDVFLGAHCRSRVSSPSRSARNRPSLRTGRETPLAPCSTTRGHALAAFRWTVISTVFMGGAPSRTLGRLAPLAKVARHRQWSSSNRR